eukprot:TRINITY_DN8725_c0_g1_i2.p1 TRINITY_DN8725_c0_g1~~TRINITY_DN8725_c0_g1_i2.p1  ORF type:complete len:336 (+),score=59.31 TRINITY_DN8725_c0_g1_i2:109-1116(+)
MAGKTLHGKAAAYADLYHTTLFDNVLPFWLNNSLDCEHGGYFTCLLRDGTVFDRDKFVWLQAREVFMFSKLYNTVEAKAEWLDAATLGADFLRSHGRDSDGYWFFSLNQLGEPLSAAHSIFSDCFAAMAFAQYYKATKHQWAFDLARETFENVERRKSNPKGKYNKTISSTRPMLSLSLPMIDLNLCLEMADAGVIDDATCTARMKGSLSLILDTFVDKKTGYIHEHVPAIAGDTVASDTFDGRLINPGHTLECLWFIMAAAEKLNDDALVQRAADLMLPTLELGWDREYGGIYYFVDMQGKPPQQLEWDQKLWWVHIETMVALALAFKLTKREV